MFKKVIIFLTALTIVVGGFFIYKELINKKPVVATSSIKIKDNDSKKEVVQSKYEEAKNIQTGIPIDYVWEFSFDEPIDEATITKEFIKVLKEDGTEAGISASLSNGGNTLLINPPPNKYEKGTFYEIQISNQLRYANGKNVSSSFDLGFITERDEVEKAKLNKNVIIVKENQIENINENGSIKLDKKVKKNLKVGDIIIIQTKEFPDGKALKIVTVDSNIGSYDVTVETPHFAELFETLDIYKTYEITKDDIQLNEDLEGVSIEEYSYIQNKTQIASSNSKTNNGEFKMPSLPGVDIKLGSQFEFIFKDFKLGDGKVKPLLNGSIKFKKPVVDTDVKIGLTGIKRMSVISKLKSENDFNLSFPITKTRKEINDRISITKPIRIPTTIPGVFIHGQFYLKYEFKANAQPEIELHFDFTDKKGFVSNDGKKAVPVNSTTHETELELKGKGKVETKLGPVVSIGLLAYEVLGGGIEGYVAAKGKGELFSGTDKDFGTYICPKFELTGVAGGNIYADLFNPFDKDDVLRIVEINLIEGELDQKIKENYCNVFDNIDVNNKSLTLNIGETVKMDISGVYRDLSSKSSSIEDDLKKPDNVSVSSTNDNVVKASYSKGKLIIKAGKNPDSDKATIKLTYNELIGLFGKKKEVTLDIPITIGNYQKLELNGEWTRNISMNTGHLTINNATSDSFDFALKVFGGAHVGEIAGKAKINGETATFIENEYTCKLDFKLLGNKISIVNESEGCLNWHGAGASFGGDYDKGGVNIKESLIDSGILDQKTDDRFRALVGSDYKFFFENINSYSTDITNIGEKKSNVIQGFVRGVAPFMTAIIVYNDSYIYAATTDSINEKVKYFSNDPNFKTNFPQIIEEWWRGTEQWDIEFK